MPPASRDFAGQVWEKAVSQHGDQVNYGSTMRRWVTYATCLWAILFAAPHTWWALGIPAGFPGGDASHRLMMSTWRYFFDVLVVLLSAWTVLIAVTLLRPPHQVSRRWISHTAAWIGAGMLLLRGIAGMIVDGRSDPIWWPTFTVGGILLVSVAWLARVPKKTAAASSV